MDAIRIEEAAPVLAFRDMVMALMYYRSILGFAHVFVNSEPPETPTYAIVQRGDVKVHLIPEGDGIVAGHGGAHFKVVGVHALHDELTRRGVKVTHREYTRGRTAIRTFTLADLDGNRLSFTERSRSPSLVDA
jgi:Glyoxalase superfamily protein